MTVYIVTTCAGCNVVTVCSTQERADAAKRRFGYCATITTANIDGDPVAAA